MNAQPHRAAADDRFHDLVADYMRRIDSGEAMDRAAFISRHAEFAEPLREYFQSVDLVEAMAGPCQATLQRPPAGQPEQGDDADFLDQHVATLSVSQDSTGGAGSAAKPPRGIPETFGRYRILKELGQGAMGAVYLAHDKQLDRKVALKIPCVLSERRDAGRAVAYDWFA